MTRSFPSTPLSWAIDFMTNPGTKPTSISLLYVPVLLLLTLCCAFDSLSCMMYRRPLLPTPASVMIQRSKMEEKTKRVNFSESDRHLLQSLIDQFSDVVDNKCCKSSSIEKKKYAWLEITEKFNRSSQTGPRTSKQLRILYDNMKRTKNKTSQNTNTTKNYLQGETVYFDDLEKIDVKEENLEIEDTEMSYFHGNRFGNNTQNDDNDSVASSPRKRKLQEEEYLECEIFGRLVTLKLSKLSRKNSILVQEKILQILNTYLLEQITNNNNNNST